MNVRNRNWRRLRPSSLQHAFELCTDHAEQIRRPAKVMADLMGVPLSTYYRWISECDMPSIRIRQFETLCGIHFVSDYLTIANGDRLVIDMPTGKVAGDKSVAELQVATSRALTVLIECYSGAADAGEARQLLDEALANWGYRGTQNMAELKAP
jgi:hypothetical protein